MQTVGPVHIEEMMDCHHEQLGIVTKCRLQIAIQSARCIRGPETLDRRARVIGAVGSHAPEAIRLQMVKRIDGVGPARRPELAE
jgi:hypothetical protein